MDYLHYIIIGAIIVLILIFQLSIFASTKSKIKIFREIFPLKDNQFELGYDDEVSAIIIINRTGKNTILKNILQSINGYLRKNKGGTNDFHLMKDIVDRNCDSVEEEINTQIPMPLYLGLVGTMAGILIGIGILVVTGSLQDLLSTTSSSTGGQGITELFGGVALAMVTGITGIFLTTYGSHMAKTAKKDEEYGKNIFLSWMQAELLPKLTNDTAAVIEKLVQNLGGFNNTFSANTIELRETLQQINVSYKSQAELIQAINQLNIENIAKANIDVYEKLKNVSNEIGVFSQYLGKANEYVEQINRLNYKLDEYEKRTQVIEHAGKFYEKNEHWLTDNIEEANLSVQGAFNRFNESIESSLKKIKESFDGNLFDFNKQFDDRQRELIEAVKDQGQIAIGNFPEISEVTEDLKSLSTVNERFEKLENATNAQNAKIDKLIGAIEKLIEANSQNNNRQMPFEPPMFNEPQYEGQKQQSNNEQLRHNNQQTYHAQSFDVQKGQQQISNNTKAFWSKEKNTNNAWIIVAVIIGIMLFINLITR